MREFNVASGLLAKTKQREQREWGHLISSELKQVSWKHLDNSVRGRLVCLVFIGGSRGKGETRKKLL
jgi:hypothetical protein